MADISTANLDAGTDSPAAARVELLAAVQRLNSLTRTPPGAGDGTALVPYKHAAAAVWRPLLAKLGESVSVTDFGAVGNGVADDSAAMTAALAASSRVFIPPGVTVKVQNVYVGHGKEIYSSKGSGGILAAPGTTALIVGSDTVLPGRVDFIRDVNIHDISITGSLTAGTTGIRINQAVSCRFANISYHGCDYVIHQQIADGCMFSEINNANLEDWLTDCNYVVYANISSRNNDNNYINFTARARKNALRLGAVTLGSPDAIHDGITMYGNTFFPNGVDDFDCVYLANALWSTIIGNKFFEPTRDGLRAEGTFANAALSCNTVAFPGRSGVGSGFTISTPSGAAAGSFGSVTIDGNTIVSPSGNGIYVSGIQGIGISNNTITAPNSQYAFAAPSYSKSGIRLSKCTRYSVRGNTVNQTLDGRNSILTPRRWFSDVFIEDNCIIGVISNASEMGNSDNMVHDTSGTAKITGGESHQVYIEPVTRAQNGVSPYLSVPAAWSVNNCAVSLVTDAANPVNGAPASNNTIEFAFSGALGYAETPGGQTFAGGDLWVTFWARCTNGTGTFFVEMNPNGGNLKSTPFMLDGEFRRIVAHIGGTVAAGYSFLRIISADVAGAVVRIAGLNMTASRAPMELHYKRAAGSAPPVAGHWQRGDEVINSAPAVGQPRGWVCTTSGEPGLWAPSGTL